MPSSEGEQEDTLMGDVNVSEFGKRIAEGSRSAMDEAFRNGARKMLMRALDEEVAEYIEERRAALDENGRRLVVRNGRMPRREIQSPLGPIEIEQPRVLDRREGERFASRILPPYLRRSPSVEALIPWLYLKGVSTNGFAEGLKAILGEGAAGLSPSTICRLKAVWEDEYKEWDARDLSGKRFVYFWADGIHFNVRLTKDRPSVLVIVGTLQDGRKELLAVYDGEQESKLSWLEVLRDLKRRGLSEGPKLAVGDGALGFWAALEEVYPETRHQRCWVHKTANVLDKMPRRVRPGAKELLHEMYRSETRTQAVKSFEEFVGRYSAKFPKAVECLVKDKEDLFTFYDFPAEHWQHIRSTNAIESTFATVRHRHRQTKGCGSRAATLAMVFKLAREAEKSWRKINGCELIVKLIQGVTFIDGEEAQAA